MNPEENIEDQAYSSETSRQIPIKRILPPNLPMLYSDGLIVQHKDGMFILYFLQSKYPMAITTEEVESIEHIESHCVAQIVLTPHQMERNLKALGTNFENFLQKMQEITNKEEITDKKEASN